MYSKLFYSGNKIVAKRMTNLKEKYWVFIGWHCCWWCTNLTNCWLRLNTVDCDLTLRCWRWSSSSTSWVGVVGLNYTGIVGGGASAAVGVAVVVAVVAFRIRAPCWASLRLLRVSLDYMFFGFRAAVFRREHCCFRLQCPQSSSWNELICVSHDDQIHQRTFTLWNGHPSSQ